MVAHHVRVNSRCRASKVRWRGSPQTLLLEPEPSRPHEPVHLAVVDVHHAAIEVVVRPAQILVVAVVVGVAARRSARRRRWMTEHHTQRVQVADEKVAVRSWNPIRAGVHAEVGVEGAVLLHDEDHMLDLVDAAGRLRRGHRPVVRAPRELETGARGGSGTAHAHERYGDQGRYQSAVHHSTRWPVRPRSLPGGDDIRPVTECGRCGWMSHPTDASHVLPASAATSHPFRWRVARCDTKLTPHWDVGRSRHKGGDRSRHCENVPANRRFTRSLG